MRVLTATLTAALMTGCLPPLLTGEETVVVQGSAMLPGIKDGDRVRFLKFDRGEEPQVVRGDIVQFLYPDHPSKFYIKRVIGLPGETVQIRGGRVFINGQELPEPYVSPALNTSPDDRPPVYVKPHYYYVLGDNRDNSSDSRMWGLLPERYIVGKAIGRPAP